jgi:hypothetical protein
LGQGDAPERQSQQLHGNLNSHTTMPVDMIRPI